MTNIFQGGPSPAQAVLAARFAVVVSRFNETITKRLLAGALDTLLKAVSYTHLIEGIRAGAGRNRNLAERTAVNTVIQGSAADLMKLAMINVHKRLKSEKLPARMLLQIHDELIFEVEEGRAAELASLVRQEMSGAYKLNVPLKVDVKVGPNWEAAEELSG